MSGDAWTREWPDEPGWYWVTGVHVESVEPALIKTIRDEPIASWRGGIIFRADQVLWGPRIDPPAPPQSSSPA